MPTAAATPPVPRAEAPEGSGGAVRVSPVVAVLAALLGAAFLALFFRWMHTQHLLSKGSPDWSHSYLVPLISAYVVWTRRAQLARVEIRPYWPGMTALLLGVVCYPYFIAGIPNHMLQGFSLVLCAFGVALLLMGPDAMRVLFFPIAYLFFAVTISEAIMLKITFQLQLLASQGSWVLLNVIGVQTEISGNTLDIIMDDGSVFPLNVAEACSGMRMLVGFFALGVAVAFIGCQRWWQRVALILLAGPVALLTNVFRVTTLGVASLFDEDLAVGDAHMAIGFVWLIPGFILFMGIAWALERVIREEPDATKGAAA